MQVLAHRKGLYIERDSVRPYFQYQKKAMYTPGPPVRDKYLVPLGLNSIGKLGERASAGHRAGAPDIPWPQVGMGPHSLLSNH